MAQDEQFVPQETFTAILAPAKLISFSYFNWRGEHSERIARVQRVFFGTTKYYRKPQWLMEARDMQKRQMRTFACSFMLNVTTCEDQALFHEFYVWSGWFPESGQPNDGPVLWGRVSARSFVEACQFIAEDNELFASFYDPIRFTVGGKGLFRDQSDAKNYFEQQVADEDIEDEHVPSETITQTSTKSDAFEFIMENQDEQQMIKLGTDLTRYQVEITMFDGGSTAINEWSLDELNQLIEGLTAARTHILNHSKGE